MRMDTVVVDAEFRRRLNIYFGRPGLASREDVRNWREERGTGDDTDMYADTNKVWFEEKWGEDGRD